MRRPKFDPKQLDRILEAQRALYAPPMTQAEKLVYDHLRAEEMARAEARRNPTPQMHLARTEEL